MDTPSEEKLKQVHPLLAEKVRAMSDALVAQGISIRVTQGLRTWEEQDALYSKVPKVTNAKGGYSYHNFGLAVDVVPMTPFGPDWDINHPVWQKIITAGLAQGLQPGALWRTFKDFPHFQLTGSLPVSPNEYVRSTYAEHGIDGVWAAAGLAVLPDIDGEISV